KKIVRNALNAGATMEVVQRASNSHYFISRDFYKTLAHIRARFLIGATPDRLRLAAAGGEGSSGPAHRLKEMARKVITGASAGVREEPRRLMHRIEEALPEDAETDEQINKQILIELLGAMGLSLPAASRMQHGVVREQAAAAWQALDQLARGNH